MNNGFKILRSVSCLFLYNKRKYNIFITLKQSLDHECLNFSKSFLTELELNIVSVRSITLLFLLKNVRDIKYHNDFERGTTVLCLSIGSTSVLKVYIESIIIVSQSITAYDENEGKLVEYNMLKSKTKSAGLKLGLGKINSVVPTNCVCIDNLYSDKIKLSSTYSFNYTSEANRKKSQHIQKFLRPHVISEGLVMRLTPLIYKLLINDFELILLGSKITLHLTTNRWAYRTEIWNKSKFSVSLKLVQTNKNFCLLYWSSHHSKIC
jgi:hypothetical protein